MEILIAIGIGTWFILTGLASTIAVFKSFDSKEEK